MKIALTSLNVGIQVMIHIPQGEVDSKGLLSLTNGVVKDFHVKRTFSNHLSTKNIETLNEILEEIFNYFRIYSSTGSGILSNEGTLVENLHHRFGDLIPQNEHDNIPVLVIDIISPLLLNKPSKCDIDTVRGRYDLDSEHDLLVGTVGGFGHGKTTLIRGMAGFNEDFKFLLVDNGRTTISNTVVKGLFVKDGYIYQKDEVTGEVEAIKVDEYKFKNQITLHTKDYVYDNIISENLSKAYGKFCKDSAEDKVLTEFTGYDKCNLKSLFGDFSIGNDFYASLLAEFTNLKESVCDAEYDFNANETLRKLFNDYYDNIVKTTLDDLNESFSLEIDEVKINFTLTLGDLDENIDNIYTPFTDNDSDKNGKLLRILVKEIFLEVSLDYANSFVNNNGEEVSPRNILNDDGTLKYHSFVFVDTVGCGHEQKNQDQNTNNSAKYIDSDIIDNAQLLIECDVIYLLENASESMKDGVKSQLYTLESLGLSNRVIMCYSHYNQFIKGDFSNDGEREEELLRLFESGLNAVYGGKEEKAKSFYENFTSSTADYNHKQIVFLKGLVKHTEPKKDTGKSKIPTRGSANLKASSQSTKATTLNKDIDECNHCLSELIDKSIYIHEDILEKKRSTLPLTDKSLEEEFAINFHTKMYPKLLEGFLATQYLIYKTNQGPHPGTTRKFGNNCFNGFPYHQSDPVDPANIVKLQPLIDAMGLITVNTSKFFDNYPPIQKNTQELNSDKILLSYIAEIKSNVNQPIKDLFHYSICKNNKYDWLELAEDKGVGVRKKRSDGIYKLLEEALDNDNVKSEVLNIIRRTTASVVNQHNRV